jgi:hypothetical protein
MSHQQSAQAGCFWYFFVVFVGYVYNGICLCMLAQQQAWIAPIMCTTAQQLNSMQCSQCSLMRKQM